MSIAQYIAATARKIWFRNGIICWAVSSRVFHVQQRLISIYYNKKQMQLKSVIKNFKCYLKFIFIEFKMNKNGWEKTRDVDGNRQKKQLALNRIKNKLKS